VCQEVLVGCVKRRGGGERRCKRREGRTWARNKAHRKKPLWTFFSTIETFCIHFILKLTRLVFFAFFFFLFFIASGGPGRTSCTNHLCCRPQATAGRAEHAKDGPKPQPKLASIHAPTLHAKHGNFLMLRYPISVLSTFSFGM